jgi:polyketide biosynthesis enoyl-CoA hydratase PksH
MSEYGSIAVRKDGVLGFIKFNRPEAGNTINPELIAECMAALDALEGSASVIVLEGDAQVFCNGADFNAVAAQGGSAAHDPAATYDLWTRLACGPFISVASVAGRANAGGVGFAAACNIVVAGPKAEFSLSEMLFGLLPACVMPFLIRRVGLQRAQYMTLMTRGFDAGQALQWGLADACDSESGIVLRKHLARLRCLGKPAIASYKRYIAALEPSLEASRALALATNREVFSDQRNLDAIAHFVASGHFQRERA